MALDNVVFHGFRNEQFDRLNLMINDYNIKPNRNKLQLIDAFANLLDSKSGSPPSTVENELSKWILQNHVEQEVHRLDDFEKVNKEKYFMSVPDKQTNVDLLNLTSWKAYTKPKIGFRSKQYTDIDNQLSLGLLNQKQIKIIYPLK